MKKFIIILFITEPKTVSLKKPSFLYIFNTLILEEVFYCFFIPSMVDLYNPKIKKIIKSRLFLNIFQKNTDLL